jgi:glyceraldehyde 3-phosphate dehydrogenase
MKKTRIAINGFGRIGRLVLRSIYQYDKEGLLDVVAVNDLTSAEQRAYLFKYDSVHRRFPGDVSFDKDNIIIDGHSIKVLEVRNPSDLPWKELNVDIVVESTGLFTSTEKARAHIEAGAKKVIISAPGTGDDLCTIVMGVNEEVYDPDKHDIISNASCTTNCLAPVVKVLNDEFGIEKGLMTTTHAYTNDQSTVDACHKKFHRGRAAALSMIPTTTGAAKAISQVLPELDGKLNGLAVRVPTPDVSAVDLVVELSRTVTREEVNKSFKNSSNTDMGKYLGYEEEDLVSMDFVGDEHSSIFAARHTMVVDNMVKVLAWYDNEWGYSCRVVDLVNFVARGGSRS